MNMRHLIFAPATTKRMAKGRAAGLSEKQNRLLRELLKEVLKSHTQSDVAARACSPGRL